MILLECPPKYNVLLEIVKEIRDDFVKHTNHQPATTEFQQAQDATGSNTAPPKELKKSYSGSTALLIVRDELALTQLKNLLLSGKEHVMDSRFRWFISQEMQDIRRKIRYNMKAKAGASRMRPAKHAPEPGNKFYGEVGDSEPASGVLESLNEQVIMQELMAEDSLEAVPSSAAQGDKGFLSSGFSLDQVKAQLTEEQQLLLLQYNVLQHTPAYSALSSSSSSNRSTNPKKRKATALGGKMTDKSLPTASLHQPRFGSSSSANQPGSSNVDQTLLFDMSFAAHQADVPVMNKHSHFTLFKTIDSQKRDEESSDEEEEVSELKDDANAMRLVFVTHSQVKSESLSLFKEQQPRCIILYDADVEIVRTIEVYQSMLGYILKVYFLVYGK
ncbi:hypothetical protein EON64_03250 [archaeon]|nr:MAG: hypothetical protein EON64_03250 [archaeon]